MCVCMDVGCVCWLLDCRIAMIGRLQGVVLRGGNRESGRVSSGPGWPGFCVLIWPSLITAKVQLPGEIHSSQYYLSQFQCCHARHLTIK